MELILRGKFVQILGYWLAWPVWTVSCPRLLSYWLLRATQDTAVSPDQPSVTHICIPPSKASPFVEQTCLCCRSGPLLSYDCHPPTRALVINRPASPLPAQPANNARCRGSSKLFPHQHQSGFISSGSSTRFFVYTRGSGNLTRVHLNGWLGNTHWFGLGSTNGYQWLGCVVPMGTNSTNGWVWVVPMGTLPRQGRTPMRGQPQSIGSQPQSFHPY